VANHDFVLLFDEEIADWLRNEGYCCLPAYRPGNRYPTKQEVIAAVEAEGLRAIVKEEYIDVVPPPDAPAVIQEMTREVRSWKGVEGKLVEDRAPLKRLVSIHCFAWNEREESQSKSITMQGNFPLELFLVWRLTQCCGQLVLYPDSGVPPIVVEPADDIGRAARIWTQTESGISWPEFYRRLACRD
jgi:hypothetical protein